MTYSEFHLIFNLPVLLVLLWLARRRLRPRHLRAILVVAAIAFAATSPWDNWAVRQGIWDFDWHRVTPVTVSLAGVAWRLPAEEYAFFVIQTVMVSLVTLLCLPRPRPKSWPWPPGGPPPRAGEPAPASAPPVRSPPPTGGPVSS